MYALAPFSIAFFAGVVIGALAMALSFAAWLASEKARFLRSPRALEHAHAGLTARLDELKRKKPTRRWFGKKKARA